MYPKNSASPEPIAIGAVVQISDGAVQTAGCTVRIKPIGVAEGDGGGTTAYSTDGIVLYTPTQAETNYTSFILIAKKTGCIPVSITIVTTASATAGYAGTDQSKIANPTSIVALTGTTIATTQKVDIDTIKTQTITCAAGVTVGVYVGGTGAAALASEVTSARMGALTDWINGGRLDLILDTIAADTTTDIPASIASLSAFVDTEVSDIKTKTDFLPSAIAGTAGGLFIAGSNAASTVASWTVTGATTHTGNVSMAAGLTVTQSTTNGQGISITGNGSGAGLYVDGGTSGRGITVTAGINQDCVVFRGAGTGDGMHVEGGATGIGLHIQGGTTSGSSLKIEAQGTNDHAIELVSIGTGNGIYVDSMTVTGTVAVGTNAIPWNAAWDTEVQSEVADAITAASLATAANVSAVVTTQMTESYAADGVAPTLAQAIFLIQQALTEFAITVNTGAGTSTTTIKKLDGSTSAATLTLNSETVPTSATRAT